MNILIKPVYCKSNLTGTFCLSVCLHEFVSLLLNCVLIEFVQHLIVDLDFPGELWRLWSLTRGRKHQTQKLKLKVSADLICCEHPLIIIPHLTNLNTNSNPSCPWLRAASRVSLPQVARVLSEVYGDRMASQCGGSDGESFPLQQKLLVCCLLLLIRNGKSKEIVLGKVRRRPRRVYVESRC